MMVKNGMVKEEINMENGLIGKLKKVKFKILTKQILLAKKLLKRTLQKINT